MDINQFVAKLNAVDWWNYEDFPNKLKTLALADQESKDGIAEIKGVEGDLLLNAKIAADVFRVIENNQCGSYCQVAKDALPFIIEIALFGNHVVARNCAINILIDLYHSCPSTNISNDSEDIVKRKIRDTISKNKANFIKFADDDKRNISLIHDSLMSIVRNVHNN